MLTTKQQTSIKEITSVSWGNSNFGDQLEKFLVI
jgi:hypothetical protein